MAIASLGDEITIPQPSSVPGGAAQDADGGGDGAQGGTVLVVPTAAALELVAARALAASGEHLIFRNLDAADVCRRLVDMLVLVPKDDASSFSSDSEDEEEDGVLSRVGVVALDVGQFAAAAKKVDDAEVVKAVAATKGFKGSAVHTI
mgnify:CR=1 FL=1